MVDRVFLGMVLCGFLRLFDILMLVVKFVMVGKKILKRMLMLVLDSMGLVIVRFVSLFFNKWVGKDGY